jgi:hypothetical protein
MQEDSGMAPGFPGYLSHFKFNLESPRSLVILVAETWGRGLMSPR